MGTKQVFIKGRTYTLSNYDEILGLIDERKIDAIRKLREETGLSLSDAKEQIEE